MSTSSTFHYLMRNLGLITLIWYNVFYSMLKRITAYALNPGSVTKNSCLFLFYVASSSFWLLMLKYGKEYEKAGYPGITSMLKHKAIERGIFIRTIATAFSALLLIAAGLLSSIFFKIVVFGASFLLILVFSNLIRKSSFPSDPSPYFIRINSFVLIMILSMILDPLLFK